MNSDLLVALIIIVSVISIIGFAFGISLWMRQQDIRRNLYPVESGVTAPALWQIAGFKLRKIALPAAFIALGLLFIFGKLLAQKLAYLAFGVHDLPGAMEASPELKEADAVVGGWVPVGTATSKIVLTVSFYAVSYILPFFFQAATHPGPTDWTKKNYTAEFEKLPVLEKFTVIRFIGLNQSIRFAASALAACLIQ